MGKWDDLAALAAAEPRGRPAQLPVEVAFDGDLPEGGTRWRYSGQVGPWDLEGLAEVREGHVWVTKLTIDHNAMDPESFEPPEGTKGAAWGHFPEHAGRGDITPTVLREIPMAAIRASIRRELLAQPRFDRLAKGFGSASSRDQGRRRAAARELERTPGGRRRLSVDHYRDVAEAALAFQNTGHTTGMYKTLGKLFDVPPHTIRDWLRRCRKLGLLAVPATPGERGVMPGPHLQGEATDG